ncbi:hypothetical protein HMPREF1985_00445 [Mitsuokella sp. oral taxon 131 str. W9106]|nr:hypothetical protein HMPREF1985_00445 [Mitsuokella sp. oral taxon 131 str. W9106]
MIRRPTSIYAVRAPKCLRPVDAFHRRISLGLGVLLFFIAITV